MQKFTLPNWPNCKQNNWLGFDKGYYCKNCEFIINKQKQQIDNQYEIDYINFNDFIPNHNISIKPRETTLRQRNLRTHINRFKLF